MFQFLKYLPLVALFQDVSKEVKMNEGTGRPIYLQRSFVGAVIALLAGLLAMLTGVKVDTEDMKVIVDGVVQICSVFATFYGAVLSIYGVILKLIKAAKKAAKSVGQIGPVILILMLMPLASQAADPLPAPPTDAQVLKWFPNAKVVDAVGTYLLRAQSMAFGSSYTIIKYKDLVNGDIQLAAVTKGGSYAGIGLSVDSVDVWRAMGKTQPDFMRQFPIFFGVTGGYVWTDTKQSVKPGWDGGVRAKIPVNIEPLLNAVGIR